MYVKNVFTTEGAIDTATSGHFTADASLTATFGQVYVDSKGTIAAMLNTLTGTIDNFMLSGEEDNEWSVALSGEIDSGGTASGFGQWRRSCRHVHRRLPWPHHAQMIPSPIP